MNTRKRPSCGGEMNLSISNKCLICPFCDMHIDIEIQDDGNTGMLDERQHFCEREKIRHCFAS